MCWTWVYRSQRHRFGDAHGAEGRDAADVVAAQVHQHEVLGALLGIGEQLDGERRVALGRGAPRPGAGDGPDRHLAAVDPHQHFGRAADQREIVELQIEEIGRGVHRPHAPVQVQRVTVPATSRRRDSTPWKMSPAAMCSLSVRTPARKPSALQAQRAVAASVCASTVTGDSMRGPLRRA